jgi:cytochrome b561
MLEVKVSAAVHGCALPAADRCSDVRLAAQLSAGFSVVWFGVLPLPDLVGKDKALAEVFKELHAGSVNLLIALVVLHAAAALYHHHIRRDGVLARMVPGLARSNNN